MGSSVLAAEHCSGSGSTATCVDVSTDPLTGKITIHVSKGTHGVVPKPKPRSTTPRKRSTPRPTYSPRPYLPRKPVVHRSPKPKPTAVPDTFASDQLTQLIPSAQIAATPSQGAVTGIPLYLSTTAPALFTTTSTLLGVAVGLSLHSTFIWSFGDGQTSTMSEPSPIAHTYAKPGNYITSLTVSWGGTWSAGGYTYDVLGGAITQQYQRAITVHQGPTAFHK